MPIASPINARRSALLISAAAVCVSAMNASGLDRQGYSLELEEVLVTAQKREENYLSVPISVNAFTAQDMINTGAVTIQDIDDFMPGVEIGDTVGGTTQTGITVRGVSSPNISSGQDPSVATFYDDSYVPRAATTIPFSDIARTEVLKGPQGTLFGRNATAGVINIVPNKPGPEFQAFAKSRLGNFNLLRLEGMINAPVTNAFAVRANVLSHQRDGTVENVGIGKDTRDEAFVMARLSALWNISAATELQFSVDVEDRDEQPRQTIGVGQYALEGSTDPFSGETALDVVGAEETREMYGLSLKLNHEFDKRLSVFGVLSYRDWETTNLEDEDGTADPRRYFDTNNIEDSDILYSEVRFNFVEGGVNLIVGANYSKEDVFQRTDLHLLGDSYAQFITIQPETGLGQEDFIWDIFGDDEATYLALSDAFGVGVLPPRFSGQLITETMDNSGEFVNWGIFADVSYQLTDALRVAAGLRYSFDEKDYSWQTFAKDIDWPVAPAILNYDPAQGGIAEENFFNKFSDSESWSKTTGRLVLDWAFSEQAITYLSYATGYKSGGFDGQSFKPLISGPFDPEEITSVELGVKGDFFNNSLRVELALFSQEIDGRQRAVDAKDGPDDPTAAPTVISADEETDGVELIAQWNVLDTLRLTGMTTYREKDEVSEDFFNAAGEPAGGEEVSSESNTEYTLRLDWTPDIAWGALLVHVDYVFREVPGPSEDAAIFATGPWYFQDEKLLSARISWQNDADTLEIALWGKNLLDEEIATNPGGLVADTLGAAHTRIEDPRTYGLDFRYAF